MPHDIFYDIQICLKPRIFRGNWFVRNANFIISSTCVDTYTMNVPKKCQFSNQQLAAAAFKLRSIHFHLNLNILRQQIHGGFHNRGWSLKCDPSSKVPKSISGRTTSETRQNLWFTGLWNNNVKLAPYALCHAKNR